jgi:prepilin-type N-terminal cleavage/methylation domain-containing protein/prepilin-type processing-associated H-X9-DG protein
MGRNRAGFTLIELLVVIAIIAILASILFPVFAKARGKARQTACLSNVKQLSLAIMSYATDYDSCTPCWISDDESVGPSLGHATWDVNIMPYVKNTQIFVCPDNPFNHETTKPKDGVSQSGPKRGYALARYAANIDQDAPPNPVATVLFIAKGAYLPSTVSDAPAEYCQQAGSGKNYGNGGADYRHNGGNNFAYLDGHAKWAAGGAGPFTNDGSGKAACDLERASWGMADDEWFGHNKKGHICFQADWPLGD